MFTEALFESLDKHSEKPLLSDKTRELTGGDILLRVKSAAQIMCDHDLKPGDRVGLCFRDQFDCLLAMLAVFWIGAVPVFLDFRIKPDRKVKLINSFGLVALVGDAPTADAIHNSIIFDTSWFSHSVENDALVMQPKHSSGLLEVSSGTTGLNKAYVLDDKVLGLRMGVHRTYETTGHTGILVAMPLAFSATHNQIFPAILDGIKLSIMPLIYSVDELIANLKMAGISGTVLPPPIIFNLLKKIEDSDEPAFPNLRLLKCGGGSMSEQNVLAAQQKLTSGFEITYGSSLVGTVARLWGDDMKMYPSSVGRPLPNVNLEIFNTDLNSTVSPGENGVLKVNIDTVAVEVISSEPTDEKGGVGYGIPGDIGYLNEDGFLFLTGRVSDVIVRAGIAISPSIIESELKSHPEIEDVAVIGVADDRLGHDLIAIAVAPTLNEKQLNQLIMQLVDQDKRPRKIHMIKALPYSSNGKLDRGILRRQFT